MVKLLEQALAELEAGKRGAALGSLVEAWRENRAPAIADIVDTLSAELTKRAPPFRAVAGERGEDAWNRALASKDVTAYERMLEIVPRSTSPASRVRALIALPPDPRLGTRAIAWLRKDPTRMAGGIFEERLVEVMNHVLDIRPIPLFTGPHAREMFSMHRDYMQDHVRRVLAYRERVKPVPEELVARLRKAVRPLPTPATEDPSALYALVYANPEDDTPRAVLADLLQQRDDPRGELIALQLARHGKTQRRSAREAELLTTWARPWLGHLGDLLEEKSVRFDRGFLSRGRLTPSLPRTRWTRAALTAPEWSTIEHLDLVDAGDQQLLVVSPALRSLRHVRNLALRMLPMIAEMGPRPWESVSFLTDSWPELQSAFDRNAVGALFPRLERIAFGGDLRHGYARTRGDHLEATAEQLCELADALPALEDIEGPFPPRVVWTFLRDPRASRIRKIVAESEHTAVTFDRKTRKAMVRLPFARTTRMMTDHVATIRSFVIDSPARTIDLKLRLPLNVQQWPPFAELLATAAEHQVTLNLADDLPRHFY